MHFALVGASLLLVGICALIFAPWRVARLMAFLDPFAHADDAAYQVVQSLYAIGSGGILGEGFAKGQQKLFYLPYPYSDFIFAVVGEEFGLVGTLAIVVAFGFLLWRGTRAALLAPDRFGMLLGIGIITGIIVQALFNISGRDFDFARKRNSAAVYFLRRFVNSGHSFCSRNFAEFVATRRICRD